MLIKTIMTKDVFIYQQLFQVMNILQRVMFLKNKQLTFF